MTFNLEEETVKWKPKAGQTILSIGSGFTSFVIRVLSKILYRFPFFLILSHVGKVVDSNRSIEASTKGVAYYNIKEEYEKAKRIIIYEHPFYNDKENLERYSDLCKALTELHEGYGYVNYFLWYFAIGVLYFPLVLIFANPLLLKLILLAAFFIIYFFLSRIFKKLQMKTKICSELVSRIDQEIFKIELGCIDFEHFSPNDVWQSCMVSEKWVLVTDFEPNKVDWSDLVEQ